jgi:hypothetical protein
MIMNKIHSKQFFSRWLVMAGVALPALVAPLPHAGAEPVCSDRYTVSADTVTDNETHLVWQRDVDVTDGGPCFPVGKGCYSWPAANDYCDGLQLDGGGWRLPNVIELQTIFDDNGHVDTVAFPNAPVYDYWSSVGVAQNMFDAWSVRQYVIPVSMGSACRVRCVR